MVRAVIIPEELLIGAEPVLVQAPSLDSRLGTFRRRRRIAFVKHTARNFGPVLVGMTLVLIALVSMASLR
jgi:hypothetical protein